MAPLAVLISVFAIVVIALQHENVVENIEHKYLEEVASTHKDFEEMCRVTRRRMSSEIMDKMRRLQEEAVVSKLNCGKLDQCGVCNIEICLCCLHPR